MDRWFDEGGRQMAVKDGFGGHVLVFRKQKSPEGRRWLASLPKLVTSLEAEWAVETGEPFTRGVAAWTAPALTAAGAAPGAEGWLAASRGPL